MSKVTRIKQKYTIHKIVTEQYEVGLYIAIYDDNTGEFLTQTTSDMKEEEYHKWLREEFGKQVIEDNETV